MADLKLKDLRYLVALADTRHFGRAAERSFVSQPTLSAQLKKLEEYLGVQLIERAPKRVSLTAAGEEIVARARRIIEASDEIVELAKGHRDPLAGRLKLALLPTIGPYLLPNVAAKLRKQLPRLELMLYEYQTDLMLEKLHSGEIDVGILALPVAHGRPRFLRAVPRAVHRGDAGQSPAEPRAPASRWKTCDDETLLLLEDGHCLRDQALEICAGSGMHEKQDFRATSLETLRQMVAAGVGITLLPELAGRGAYGAARGVTIKPFVETRADTHHRRGVAQVECAARPSFSRWRSRSRRTRCETAALRAARADGRGLSAHWFAADAAAAWRHRVQRRHGVSANLLFQAGAIRWRNAATTRCVYDYRGMGTFGARASLARRNRAHERLGIARHARRARRGR